MIAARPDPLARWRAARAAKAPATVATVATALPVVATPANPQKSANVATVASVAAGNRDVCVARDDRDAWGLTEADKAEGLARLFGAPTVADPATPDEGGMDHDAAERAAMVAFYAEEGGTTAYDPSRPDEIRDGLYRGFHAHRPTWDALPYGPDRGAAFADARVDPGACPTCAGRRWWRHAADAAGALTCATCHPADHLPAEAVQEVVT